jgi:hypothetical protein
VPHLILDFSSFAMRRPGVRIPSRPPDFKGLTSYWEGGDPRFFNLNAMLENEVIAPVHVSLRARWPRGALQEFQSLVASSALHLLLEFIKGEEGRTLLSRYAGEQLSTHIDLRELQQRLNSFETEDRYACHLSSAEIASTRASFPRSTMAPCQSNRIGCTRGHSRPAWFQHLLYAARYPDAHLELPSLAEAADLSSTGAPPPGMIVIAMFPD